MIYVENTGSVTGVTVAELRSNLRLPADMDTTMLTLLLSAAISHVEQSSGLCLIDKTVTQTWLRHEPVYYLKYMACEITEVSINDEEVDEDDYTAIKCAIPSCVILNEAPDASVRNVIKIVYTSEGAMTDSLKNLVITIATMYYNNPEGLDQINQQRINNLINQNTGSII